MEMHLILFFMSSWLKARCCIAPAALDTRARLADVERMLIMSFRSGSDDALEEPEESVKWQSCVTTIIIDN